jgi:hypothetical protein
MWGPCESAGKPAPAKPFNAIKIGDGMKCQSCKNDTFRIEESECDTCEFNGVWDKELGEYRCSDDPKEERTQATEEGECDLGHTYSAGCHLYICTKCKHHSHFPTYNE